MERVAPLLTNRAVMVRRAWEKTFKLDVFPETWRGVVRCVAGLTFADNTLWGCGTEALIAAVQLTNGVGYTASKTQIRATTKAGLIVRGKNPTDARYQAYRLGPGVTKKLTDVDALELKISLAVWEQSKTPEDPRAGSKNVPDDIYFNFWDQDSVDWMRERVRKIENENSRAQKCQEQTDKRNRGDHPP